MTHWLINLNSGLFLHNWKLLINFFQICIFQFADRVWPMIIMGFLMFIPGAYHVRIAFYAYKGLPGYSFDDIPEFE